MTPADSPNGLRRSLAEGESLTPAASPSKPKPWTCPECRRLDQQEEAATVAYDRSRMADIRILRRRHAADGHRTTA